VANEVEIVNAAIIQLGHSPITALIEDSDQARAANVLYPLCRDDVLRAHPWNFATIWSSLAKLAEDPVSGDWDFAYALPVNTLRVLAIEPDTWEYAVSSGKLYTNLDSPVVVQLVTRVTDTSLFDPVFVQALIYRLAMDLCLAITARTSNRQVFEESYRLKLQEARTIDGQEGSPLRDDDSPLKTERIIITPGTKF